MVILFIEHYRSKPLQLGRYREIGLCLGGTNASITLRLEDYSAFLSSVSEAHDIFSADGLA